MLTEDTRKQLLSGLGLTSSPDLFSTIPPRFRRNADFHFQIEGRALPKEPSEADLRHLFSDFAADNRPPFLHFCGNGSYDELLPVAALSAADFFRHSGDQSKLRERLADELTSRLLALTGAAEARIGFGSRALALEASLDLARRRSQGNPVWILGAVPGAGAIVHRGRRGGFPVETLPVDPLCGSVDEDGVRKRLAKSDKIPSVAIVGFPNRFGIIENLAKVRSLLPESLLIAVAQDAGAFSLFDPSEADLIVGDLQPFGAPSNQSTGRLVFLSSRKAGLLIAAPPPPHPSLSARALATLSLWGGDGLRNWGESLHSHWQYFVRECESVGLPLRFRKGNHFREGILEVPHLKSRFERALAQRIWPGVIPKNDPTDPQIDFSNGLLVSVHSGHTKADLDALVEMLSSDRGSNVRS